MLKQLILTTILLLPILVSAQDPVTYKTLVGIPGIENGQSDFQSFINSLYAISISLAAVLAVIKIIIAGVKYMLTDIVTSKGEAKKDIKGALLGLLVVLGAVLILSVINPQLVNIDVKLERVEIPPAVTIASNNLSVEIQPGDSFFSAPNEEACTSVDADLCNSGKQYAYACYKGEWLAEKNVCLVRRGNTGGSSGGNTGGGGGSTGGSGCTSTAEIECAHSIPANKMSGSVLQETLTIPKGKVLVSAITTNGDSTKSGGFSYETPPGAESPNTSIWISATPNGTPLHPKRCHRDNVSFLYSITYTQVPGSEYRCVLALNKTYYVNMKHVYPDTPESRVIRYRK